MQYTLRWCTSVESSDRMKYIHILLRSQRKQSVWQGIAHWVYVWLTFCVIIQCAIVVVPTHHDIVLLWTVVCGDTSCPSDWESHHFYLFSFCARSLCCYLSFICFRLSFSISIHPLVSSTFGWPICLRNSGSLEKEKNGFCFFSRRSLAQRIFFCLLLSIHPL